jgi:hypothetical protein
MRLNLAVLAALALMSLSAVPERISAATIEVRMSGGYGPWPQMNAWTPVEVRSIANLTGYVPPPAPALDDYGGRTAIKLAATGFFRVQKNGRR